MTSILRVIVSSSFTRKTSITRYERMYGSCSVRRWNAKGKFIEETASGISYFKKRL